MSKVQISQELFLALVKYHLLEMNEDEEQIKKELKEKLDAMVRRTSRVLLRREW